MELAGEKAQLTKQRTLARRRKQIAENDELTGKIELIEVDIEAILAWLPEAIAGLDSFFANLPGGRFGLVDKGNAVVTIDYLENYREELAGQDSTLVAKLIRIVEDWKVQEKHD
jgi:hypothetical protein